MHVIITFFSHPVEIWAPLLTTTCGAVQVHPKVAALTRQRVRKSAFQVLGPAVVVVTMVVGIAIGLSSEPGDPPRPFNALDVVVATIAVLSNYERHHLNSTQAEALARAHGLPLVMWRLPLTGRAAELLDAATLLSLPLTRIDITTAGEE